MKELDIPSKLHTTFQKKFPERIWKSSVSLLPGRSSSSEQLFQESILIVKALKCPQIKMGICQILLPCLFFHRNKLAFTQSRAVSYFFDGSGYALARNIERRGRFSQVTRFDIEVRTPTDNGLILLMINGVSTKPAGALYLCAPQVPQYLQYHGKSKMLMSLHLTSGMRKYFVFVWCMYTRGGNWNWLCEDPGSEGPELESALIQRQTGLQTADTLVMTLWERLQLGPVVAPLFKCECTIKEIRNFCEVTPMKQPLCGSWRVSQGVLELNI